MQNNSPTPSTNSNESLTKSTQPLEPTKFKPPEIRGDQRVFFVGKTNSGKSYVARYLLKVARQHGWRIVIIDPKKDWQGRGDEARPYSDGKKQKGTVDSPVPVTSFQPIFVRTNLSTGFLGLLNGASIPRYHGNWQYDSVYRRSNTVGLWFTRSTAWNEDHDYPGPFRERGGMGWYAATNERANPDQRSSRGVVNIPVDTQGRQGDGGGAYPNGGDTGIG